MVVLLSSDNFGADINCVAKTVSVHHGQTQCSCMSNYATYTVCTYRPTVHVIHLLHLPSGWRNLSSPLRSKHPSGPDVQSGWLLYRTWGKLLHSCFSQGDVWGGSRRLNSREAENMTSFITCLNAFSVTLSYCWVVLLNQNISESSSSSYVYFNSVIACSSIWANLCLFTVKKNLFFLYHMVRALRSLSAFWVYWYCDILWSHFYWFIF